MSPYEKVVRYHLERAQLVWNEAFESNRQISPLNGEFVGKVNQIRLQAASDIIRLAKEHLDTIARLKL